MKKTFEGRILKGVGGNYWVSDGKHEGMASARGVFRLRDERPAAGDLISFEATDDPVFPYRILEIHARRNALPRPQVVNVEQLLLVFAVRSPDPDFLLLDKLAAIAASQEIEILLVFTKLDLMEDESAAIEALQDRYGPTKWPIFFSSGSATDAEGEHELDDRILDELRPHLANKLTALAGPSGSGKSTLLNHLSEEDHMETGGISERLGRGRHTTRHAELFAFEEGFIVDTPGFSMLDITEAGLEPEELPLGFPEMFPAAYDCRFSSCHHLNEPGCAVRESDTLHPERYENYRQLREALDQYDPYS